MSSEDGRTTSRRTVKPPWLITNVAFPFFSVNSLHGIAVDDKECLYFTSAHTTLRRIRIHNCNVITTLVPTTRCAQHIIWNDNALYMCLPDNNMVTKYSLDVGERTKVEAFQVVNPYGITKDNHGNMYVTDRYYVHKWDKKTQKSVVVAGSGKPGCKDGLANEAQLYFTSGITVSDDGTIYVAQSSCIRRIKDGIVSTFAGNPRECGFKNGTIQEALFGFIVDIHLDRHANLFVCDTLNGLRKIDIKNGVVSKICVSGSKHRVDCFAACKSICEDSNGNLYLGSDMGIFKMEYTWKWIRFLWIGYLKEDASYCMLAAVPKDVIKYIIAVFHEQN